MTIRMLIDARHPEETRVAVVKGNRVEEFDFEAAARKQIKGNIYLAKVTRVEPSLQAAFIEYGGNRHGFLAFSEIHPDYYQIPREDREALLREEEELEQEALEEVQAYEAADAHLLDDEAHADADADGEVPAAPTPANEHHDDSHHERMRERRMELRRRYKIQEVIKRRQVLLVQVVKEERGNKGAALTTYLSLAGRYCVLMPNTSHGGGISRKISSSTDRRRLKTIMDDLSLPPGMACIVRTAGLSRTKTEIKRDFDYLTRLWDGIRDLTLSSSAPALIHEDSDLIKRAIRDIYTREIDEVLVDGDEGYAHARQFMKLLMPSHVKKVKHYIDPVPLFQRAQVETQLNAMFQPVVQLKSGGYLVINPTEALVSIDINSGRSTREHNIEETAYKTNIEAADEIARQLRLRDLAGLVVVDFIDMEHSGNVRKVERQMKEALKNDRARIQVGRISSFGLLEMSRQRLRTGVLEASTVVCPMCEGAAIVRSASSAALSALRSLEEEAVRGRASILTLRAATEVAVYILNRKRGEIVEIEERYGVRVDVLPDTHLLAPRFLVEGAGGPPQRAAEPARVAARPIVEYDDDDVGEAEADEEEEDYAEDEAAEAEAPRARANGEDRGERRPDGEQRGRRRRRRRRRGGDDRPASEQRTGETDDRDDAEPLEADADSPDAAPREPRAPAEAGEGQAGRRRRRGRRGGRGRLNGEASAPQSMTPQVDEDGFDLAPVALGDTPEEPAPAAPVPEPQPAAKAKPRRRARKVADPIDSPEPVEETLAAEPEREPEPEVPPAPAPKRARARRKPAGAEDAEAVTAAPAAAEAAAPDAEPEPTPEVPAAKPRTRRKAPSKASAAAEDAAPALPEAAIPAQADMATPAPPVTAAGPADATQDESTPRGTPRGGWWQRTFGG